MGALLASSSPAATLSALIAACATGGSSLVDVASCLTRWFLSHDVRLTGSFSCANVLHRPTNAAVVVQADVYFPYFGQQTRVTTGFEYTITQHASQFALAHLESGASSLSLHARRLYLIGAKPSTLSDSGAVSRICHVCGGKHDIRRSSCTMIIRFFAIRHQACLQHRIRTTATGARVLSTHSQRASVLRDCNLQTHLCAKCSADARRTGFVWFRMTGKCANVYCPNHSTCDCKRRNSGCVDYVYINEGFKHNVAHDDLAAALQKGNIISLRCAQYNKSNIEFVLKHLYSRLISALREQRHVSIHTVAKWSGMYEEEVLALCMHERRLADFLQAGRKSFTLSVVNGFIELHACRVGAWLDGRVVYDHDGRVWHVADGARLVVERAAPRLPLSTLKRVAHEHAHVPSQPLCAWIG